jgi:hypothetical protein
VSASTARQARPKIDKNYYAQNLVNNYKTKMMIGIFSYVNQFFDVVNNFLTVQGKID